MKVVAASMAPTVSLVISTYNWPAALDRVLASVAHQSLLPVEVIIADDGSEAATGRVVAAWRERLPMPLRHVWQPDVGFRVAAARNRAAATARGDLLIFVDGDCLLMRDTVAAHARLAEPGWAVAGNRILLSADLTPAIERGEVDPLAWGRNGWLKARMHGGVGRLFPLLALPGQSWRRRRPTNWLQFRTCNASVWRADFERINGFEEEFSGWGFEDSDLAIRLINAGIGIKSGRFATAVLHIWHRERARDDATVNRQRALAKLGGGVVRARIGLAERRPDDVFEPPIDRLPAQAAAVAPGHAEP